MAAFTLPELAIALAVAAILLGIAVPNFHAMLQRQRMATAVNEFFVAINLTRSEAVMRGGRVDLVPADGVDWAKGWIVFVDKNNNLRADLGEKIIYSRGPVFGGLTIKSSFTDSSKPYLAYNGSGRTRTNASSQTPQLGTVSFFLDNQVRRIKLNFLGRARSCNPERDSTCTGANDAS
ncbi:MAG: GspH/FimT family pseudopilin [Burkholderiales bacterium]|nr:GspH/FimT family pseudopilin [Burkholderiales bacterium]